MGATLFREQRELAHYAKPKQRHEVTHSSIHAIIQGGVILCWLFTKEILLCGFVNGIGVSLRVLNKSVG